MDTLSHGLWGGVFFGRKKRLDFWMAMLFGMLPDLLSFGIYFALAIFGFFNHPSFASGQHPDSSAIPAFVHVAYNLTHSLVVFALVFGVVYLVRKNIYWPLLAWPLHVLYDIPTHSADFFPTPFLWPLSDFHIHGVSWGQPFIFFPNWIALLLCLFWFFFRPYRKSRQMTRHKAENAL